MNVAALTTQFKSKAFGQNTANINDAAILSYLQRGYQLFFNFLSKRDEIGLAFFGVVGESLSPTAGDFLLPTTLDRLIRVENTARDALYIQKPINALEWTQITTGAIYISYIKTLETLGDGTAGTVATPSISPSYHPTIVDFAVFEYFNDLGGGYANDAGKWLGIANSGAQDAFKGLYWNVVAKSNQAYDPKTSWNYGFYYVNVGFDVTTGKRKIRLYNE